MPSDPDQISRETIFTVHAADAEGFYKLMITIGTAFLGGSLLFLEKFVPTPNWGSLLLLVVGWVSLISSIAWIVQVRRSNLDAARLSLNGDFAEARKCGESSDKWTTRATCSLIIGMAALAAAGAVTLGGTIMAKSTVRVPVPGKSETRTIHFGSTGPSKLADTGQQGTASPPSGTVSDSAQTGGSTTDKK